MSQSIIGALRVNLGLDSAQFTRGMTQAQRSLATARRQFIAVAGAAAALGSAITTMALRGARDIDRIAKAARRIDGTTGAFQALEFAASEAGVSLSALANDLQTMNRELSSGSAGAGRAMRRLGMSADDLLSLDADERVAAIADRIQELGLSAGEASVLLRDLGVRNREMVLMMIQGGAAIRAARDDIRDYGLEIDDALGQRIEAARDQIGRLSVVVRFLGQRLAAEIVPALGQFARAITDSMREGGRLRVVLDFLVDNLQRMVTILGTAVAFFGIRYVAAMAVARLATFSMVGALAALKTALIRTGVGAFIVGAGFLVDLLIRLRTATGEWGESLSILGDLAAATWRGIMTSAQAINPALEAIWHDVRASFLDMLADLGDYWRDWLRDFGANLRILSAVPGIGSAFELVGSALQGFQGGGGMAAAAGRARGDADDARARSGAIVTVGFDAARQALARLNEALASNGDITTETTDAARALREELEGLAGDGAGGGGGGARAAAEGLDSMTDAASRLEEAMQSVQQSFGNAFVNFVSGAQSARQAIAGLLRDLSRLLAQSAWQDISASLSGGAGGGFLSRLVGGLIGGIPSFDGGGFTGSGPRTGGLDGRGGFLAKMHPNETVIDHTKGGGQVTLRFLMPDGVTFEEVENTARAVVSVEGPRVVRNEVASGGVDRPMSRFGMKPQRLRR